MAVVREIFDNRKVKLVWVTKDYQLADVLIKKKLQMSDLQKSLEMTKLLDSTNQKCK